MVNWSRYLESLCNAYAQWWQVYTITDVVGRKRVEVEPSPLLFDFGLMVQTVERDREQRAKGEETVERLSVLEGLRKYASEHVLLVGRPGSGKSTALVRLLLEEAQKNLTPPAPLPCKGRGEQDFSLMDSPLLAGEGLGERSSKGHGNQPKIPVLVELRYYRTSILDLIQDFLQRHDPNLTVDAETLKTSLRQGQLLLLVDGLNEVPSEEARRDLHKLRQDYQKTTPMIFTTRDLGVGGDLDITKKLEMQPLSEAQMQQFVRAYLPEQGEQMLRQLGNRLREFGQTPLLLWMLCSLFRTMGKVPPNLGKVFRQFAQSYYGKLKQDVPVTEESRDWCQLLLEQLAFSMTQGKNRTDLQVAIPKQEAEEILTAFLRHEGLDQPRNRALKWFKDLLKHHLIQLGAGDQIEFRHQLIQEYYTAEYLLKVLTPQGRTSPPAPLLVGEGSKIVPVPPFPAREGGLGGLGLSDDELKRDYLNYLKWTEPLALMLELVEDETQAVRVVKLALEVDLRLGARLAGAVKPKSQEKAVALVVGLEVPQSLKIEFLGITRSTYAIPELLGIITDPNPNVREKVAEILGEIGDEKAISALITASDDPVFSVRWAVVAALGKIGSERVIPVLEKASADSAPFVRLTAVSALGKLGNEAAVLVLQKIVEHPDYPVRLKAAYELGQLDREAGITVLLKALDHPNSSVCELAIDALSLLSNDAAVAALHKALEHPNLSVRMMAAQALGQISSEANIPALRNHLEEEDSDSNICLIETAERRQINSEEAIAELMNDLQSQYHYIALRAAAELIEIGYSESVIPVLAGLLESLDEQNCDLAGFVLFKLNMELAIPLLLNALKHRVSSVYIGAICALERIDSKAVIPVLIEALEHPNLEVRLQAASALVRHANEAGIPVLWQALKDKHPFVRSRAASALGQLGSETVIPAVLEVLEGRDVDFLKDAASVLVQLGSPKPLSRLWQIQLTGKVNLLSTIEAIQERCKFYNYTLTQPPSSPVSRKSKPKNSSKKPKSLSLMHILHLSDLHFCDPKKTTYDQATLWSSQLAEDLCNELDIPHLDALILSGDIANYSTQDEYNAAEKFLNKLRQQFPLTPEQIIIVPGNHDINWESSKAAYSFAYQRPNSVSEDKCIPASDVGVLIRQEEDYKNRFANFSHFYQAIKGEPYPLDYEQQGIVHHLTEQNLLILGLNSAWQLDHHYRTRANIHPIALSNALDQISRDRKTYQNCLKIAVWHHPIHSSGEDRITDAAFLDRLAVAGFRFFLHGHVHEAKTSNYRYDMTKDGRNLDQICAGTFGAPTKELVTGTPWQYNLLKFEGNKLTVRTRCRRKENGTWEADSIWRQGKRKSSTDFYAIAL